MKKYSKNIDFIKKALTIRAVENKFLDLFSDGKLNGTVHTSVGQEFSAVSFAGQINKTDYIFSNHRCHGHYIAFENEYQKLIAELMGKKNGVCGGIGGSQHLCTKNFFSNGPQGALAPVAAGVAFASKKNNDDNIVLCFIGDGTLGEGIIYETLNLASLYQLPILFICENNYYAQSTKIENNLSGSISSRAKAFGLKTWEGNTWDWENLLNEARIAIDEVRESKSPGFFICETYRLNAHSKSDDNRDLNEINNFIKKDPLTNMISLDKNIFDEYNKIINNVNLEVKKQELNEEMQITDYINESNNQAVTNLIRYDPNENFIKQSDQLNSFFNKAINNDNNVIILGEDIASPYGGAFKITKDLSDSFPENVVSTPISEAGITGLGIGLGIAGYKPFVEIMFGDFITYAFDQILSNLSKFPHMFNNQVRTSVFIRTPMGGRRGYGPTHSQSLEKLLYGVPNVNLISLNTLTNAEEIYSSLIRNEKASIIIENKLDYGRLVPYKKNNLSYEFYKDNSDYPNICVKPKDQEPDITFITFGGSVHLLFDVMEDIFVEYELIPQIIMLTKLYPIDLSSVFDNIKSTSILITVEEGVKDGGIGSDILENIREYDNNYLFKSKRIGAKNVPIPSVRSLENKVLPNKSMIFNAIDELIK
jgi:2-oxoisovalerate dehydrogenase E1 component